MCAWSLPLVVFLWYDSAAWHCTPFKRTLMLVKMVVYHVSEKCVHRYGIVVFCLLTLWHELFVLRWIKIWIIFMVRKHNIMKMWIAFLCQGSNCIFIYINVNFDMILSVRVLPVHKWDIQPSSYSYIISQTISQWRICDNVICILNWEKSSWKVILLPALSRILTSIDKINSVSVTVEIHLIRTSLSDDYQITKFNGSMLSQFLDISASKKYFAANSLNPWLRITYQTTGIYTSVAIGHRDSTFDESVMCTADFTKMKKCISGSFAMKASVRKRAVLPLHATYLSKVEEGRASLDLCVILEMLLHMSEYQPESNSFFNWRLSSFPNSNQQIIHPVSEWGVQLGYC